jgi:dienelactone hydrolase
MATPAFSQLSVEIAAKFTHFCLETDTLQVKARLFIPENYDSSKLYPVVVGLHGLGQVGTDNKKQILYKYPSTIWGYPDIQAEHPCFIFAPQSPSGSIAWRNFEYNQGVDYLLDSLIQTFSVDTNRVYVTGLSLGGFGTWNFIARAPDTYAAAIPVSGGLTGDETKDSALVSVFRHIPVWNWHENRDAVVNVRLSRSVIKQYPKFGQPLLYTHKFYRKSFDLPDSVIDTYIMNHAHVIYSEIDGATHDVWRSHTYNYYMPLVKKWLFQQRKHSKENILVNRSDTIMTVSGDQSFTFSASDHSDSLSIWLGHISSCDWKLIDRIPSDADTYTFRSDEQEDHPFGLLRFVALDSSGHAIGKDYTDLMSINNDGNGHPYIELLDDRFLETDYPNSDIYRMKIRLGDPESDTLMVSYYVSYDNAKTFDFYADTNTVEEVFEFEIHLDQIYLSDSTVIRAEVSDGEYTNMVQTLSIKNIRGISVVSIPDTVFLNALIELGIDKDGDSLISYAEAGKITFLDVRDPHWNPDIKISDMTGIESFVNLDTLLCSDNKITELDLSNNTKLEYIKINHMPTLTDVCVWTMPFPPDGVVVDSIESPNVNFTTACSGSVGFEPVNDEAFAIFPNPAENLLTVKMENTGHTSIRVTSLNGKLLYESETAVTTHHIDLSSFQSGVYFITIRSKDFVTTRKIIKLGSGSRY